MSEIDDRDGPWGEGFPATDEFGNDVNLVECMLLLTPAERLEQLQASVELICAVRRAGVRVGTIPATAAALE
jgi:hypothetical protein